MDALLDSVKWDEKGLAVAIAQNLDTGAILMQGFANKDALVTTITSRKATFYSRSRSSLWTKGETSMNFINVHDIFLDCDRDSVSYFLLELSLFEFSILSSWRITSIFFGCFILRLYILESQMGPLVTPGQKLVTSCH